MSQLLSLGSTFLALIWKCICDFRLQDEERRRQEHEDMEIDIKQQEIRRLIMDYMVRTSTSCAASQSLHVEEP